jgi:cytidylate kinase
VLEMCSAIEKRVDPARRLQPIVAIDGPAGAGKSTVARRLADTLGYVLVDTGAMYRTVALAAKDAGIAWTAGEQVGALARSLVSRNALSFARDPDGGVRVRLDGTDATDRIRAPDIGMGASTVSAHKAVRDALLEMQRQAGRAGGVVLEGRDIGTVVFPDAEVKFFLTARPEVRARRRFDELVARGTAATFEETLEDVRRRDEQDMTRPVAPLRQAADATRIDSSEISVDDAVAWMAERVRARAMR